MHLVLPFRKDPWLTVDFQNDFEDELINHACAFLDASEETHQVQVTETEIKTSVSPDYGKVPVITLENTPLWYTLQTLKCEMMYTVQGRRLFPSIIFDTQDLEPHHYYAFALELVDLTGLTYKYDKGTNEWVERTSKAPHFVDPERLYVLPGCPQLGSLLQGPINFEEVRIARAPLNGISKLSFSYL